MFDADVMEFLSIQAQDFIEEWKASYGKAHRTNS